MPVKISAEIERTLASGGPVVALESAIVTHGLPHPDNLEVALACEQAVRDNRAVPATIAVREGRVVVGLNSDELQHLASAANRAAKISVRDLGPAAARGANGGTTIAATAQVAARVGIRVLATGGLGGVHSTRGDSWDVSADLLALRDSSIVVVCSGVKSILDLHATLEFLETASVSVVAYAADTVPGFYIADTEVAAPWRLETPEEVATAFMEGARAGHTGALVVANPPDEAAALPRLEHERLLAAAVAEARRRGVSGKEVTPFLLSEMSARSDGRTLAANKALVIGNAALAAEVAGAISAVSSRS